MKKAQLTTKNKWLFFVVLTIICKLLLACLGHNFDIQSSKIIGDIVSAGDNVYVHTHRYNYGPLWAYVLGGLRWIQHYVFQSDTLLGLHLLIALVLSFADVGIATILRDSFSKRAGYLFLINPVSALISGYHGQFDNVAIYLGLLSVVFLLSKKHSRSVLALGISLIVKHILAFALFWLVVNKNIKRIRLKVLYAVVPAGIFAVSFLPFILDRLSRSRVKDGVLGYSFGRDNALLSQLVDEVFLLFKVDVKGLLTFLPIDPARLVFILLILLLGILFRNRPIKEILPLYLVSLVACTSQMSDQYLAIPLIAAAIYFRHWEMKAYVVYTFLYLLLDSQNNLGKHMWEFFPALANSEGLNKMLNVKFAQVLLWIFLIRSLFMSSASKIGSGRQVIQAIP